MKARNGKNAYGLTAPMLEALHQLLDAEPQAVMVPNVKTAVALLNRGFVMRSEIQAPLCTSSTYYITKAGRKAYGIARAMAGVP